MPELAASTPVQESSKEEMPTMGFLDHLEELRKRIVYSIAAIAIGAVVCWTFRERLVDLMQRPIVEVLHKYGLPEKLVYLNPVNPFNLNLKVAGVVGLFVTSPFVLYQVWMFIAPGLYRNEKRYVTPFMISTVALFLSGGYFGYRFVFPQALAFLVDFGKQFQPMVTIEEYTQLFVTVVLGMGLIFEMPILIFFLALMGIVSAGFMWRNIRYAILLIFIIAGILTPTPDVVNMCIFASPMLVLYVLSIGIAWFVHPEQRKKRAEKSS